MTHSAALPRPRLTIRVGITGHRLNKLEADGREAVRARLSNVFSLLGERIGRLQASPGCELYDARPHEIRLVSALAEGADRFAAQAAPASWTLAAILPMPVAAYEADFRHAEDPSGLSLREFRELLARAVSVTELPEVDPGGHGEEARARHYAELGSFLVRQVDVLVAVWDGRPADGPGGTATVITEALARDVGVIWIHPERPQEARLLSGFAQADFAQPVAEPLTCERIDTVLDEIAAFRPPEAGHDHGHDHGHAGTQPAPHAAMPSAGPGYVRERWPRPLRFAVAFQLLRVVSRAGRWSWPLAYDSQADLLTRWDPYFADVEAGAASPHVNDDLRDVLLPRSVWADALAWVHSHLYRSAYVTTFLLAGLAVPMGLAYLFLQDSPAILDIKAAFVALELLVIIAVVVLVQRGTRRHWHKTWIETRELSELLRLSRPPRLGRGARGTHRRGPLAKRATGHLSALVRPGDHPGDTSPSRPGSTWTISAASCPRR